MTNQLPETIRREAKRLLKLAKESNCILKVTNLSEAQELVSRIKGAQSSFDALEPVPAATLPNSQPKTA
jgi:hypothetical protein